MAPPLILPGSSPAELLAGRDGEPWLIDATTLSRGEARERVLARAQRLREAGLRPGERVAWLPKPTAAGILAALAALEAGAQLALLPLRESHARLEEERLLLRPRLLLDEDEEAPRRLPPAEPAGLPRRLLLRSSGSSGRPRWLMHGLAGLLASARAAARHLRLGAADTWLLSLPLDHVGGLGILLRSLVSGCALALPSGAGLAADLEARRPQLLSLVPAQLRRLAHREPPVALRAVLVGGAPLDAALRRQALAHGWPLVPSYGASETGSLVCAGADDSGCPLPPHLVEVDKDGFITVDSPALFEAVLDERGAPVPRSPGPWRSQDLGHWREGRLVVLGRADGLINSGGEKIRPEEVEEALLTLREVELAAVVAIPDTELGERPAAFVAWRGASLSLAELRPRLEPLLARHKHPARLWPWPADEEREWKPRRAWLRQLALELLDKC